MKVIATILAVLILMMPVQPLFAGMSCIVLKMEKARNCCSKKKKSACSMNKKEANENNSDNACKKKCCPVECCTNCYFTGIQRPIFEVPYVIIKKVDFQLWKDNIVSSFITDFWHPPNFA